MMTAATAHLVEVRRCDRAPRILSILFPPILQRTEHAMHGQQGGQLMHQQPFPTQDQPYRGQREVAPPPPPQPSLRNLIEEAQQNCRRTEELGCILTDQVRRLAGVAWPGMPEPAPGNALVEKEPDLLEQLRRLVEQHRQHNERLNWCMDVLGSRI